MKYCRVLGCVLTVGALVNGVFCGANAQGQSLEEIATVIEQLTSHKANDREQGEKWLAQHEMGVFPRLAELLDTEDQQQRTQAARAMAVFASPWARAIEQGQRHMGQIQLPARCHDIQRPVGHRYAGLMRGSLLKALAESLESGEVNRTAIPAICRALVEVADQKTTEEIVSLLEGESSRSACDALLNCLEQIHGLPDVYTPGGICGNSTEEEIAAFQREETARCEHGKTKLLAWHQKHARQPLKQRHKAALDVWDERLQKEQWQHVYYGEMLAYGHYASLVRMGRDAKGAIEQRVADSKDEAQQALYKLVLVAITGEVDKPLVKSWLEGTSDNYQRVACEMIVTAGSEEWLHQLERLQNASGAPTGKASWALAAIHRTEAIPLLRKADKSNFSAEAAIKELQAWGE